MEEYRKFLSEIQRNTTYSGISIYICILGHDTVDTDVYKDK